MSVDVIMYIIVIVFVSYFEDLLLITPNLKMICQAVMILKHQMKQLF